MDAIINEDICTYSSGFSKQVDVYEADTLRMIAQVRFNTNPYILNEFWVMGVLTYPQFRKQHIMFRLLQHEMLRTIAIGTVENPCFRLAVANDNISAINLYKKLGFTLYEPDKRDVNGLMLTMRCSDFSSFSLIEFTDDIWRI